MSVKPVPQNFERPPLEHPQAKLERAFIEELLAFKGYCLQDLHLLPEETVKAIMTEASIYASNKLAEFEMRNHLANELQGKERLTF